MIKRIVKLTIKEEHIEDFFAIFSESKNKIVAQPGCHYAEMLQDEKDKRICFTYSLWDDQESLDAYRGSTLFGEVWPRTKALFDDKPEAWSLASKAIAHDSSSEK